MARTPLSPLPTPAGRHEPVAGPRSPLRLVTGGIRQPGLVTIPRGEYDELCIELQVAQTEACALVAELLPVARRIEVYAIHDGSPGEWNLAVGLIDRLTRFARRCEPKPAA